MRWLVSLLIATTACFAPTRYAVNRSDVDCQRALRVARRTMDQLGYTVTEMIEPKEHVPGVIAGTRRLPSGSTTSGKVRIVCDAGGVRLQPIEDSLVPDFEFSRAFGYSYTSLVQRPDVETPVVESGVQVLVESLDVYEQRLDLGGEAVGKGKVLARITVRNGTDRAVAVDGSKLSLITTGGTSTEPVSGPSADAALASGPGGDRVRRELLGRLEVPPRTTAVRFLVYPGGAYREARIDVEDVETGETDGFVTAVQ
jgi:hypothetical protein